MWTLLKSSPLLILLFLAGAAAPVLAEQSATLQIITGSAMLESIVEDLGEKSGKNMSLIPPAMCPGHYDLRPGDLKRVAESDAVLLHAFQGQMANITGLMAAARVPKERLYLIKTSGAWMIPAMQREMVDEVGKVLKKLMPDRVARIDARLQARREAIDHTASLTAQAAFKGIPVLCNSMQAEFAEWLGFNIIDRFGRAEELSVARINALIRQAKAQQAALIIDNLQSGDNSISAMLARDVDAEHVVLSNFPGAYPDTETWEKAFTYNLKLLREALSRWRATHD